MILHNRLKRCLEFRYAASCAAIKYLLKLESSTSRIKLFRNHLKNNRVKRHVKRGRLHHKRNRRKLLFCLARKQDNCALLLSSGLLRGIKISFAMPKVN